MAEAKRIELTTVGPLKKDRKPKEDTPTYRFQLTLCESNEKTCPEYSYLQLLKSVRGESENGTVVSIKNEPIEATELEDPFADDANEQEKLKALAQKFEEKYAPKPGKKPWKKRGRLEDYIDLGMGYDETDPFIDNTDAYDELVPSTLTTQYGGFYINSGKLDFKEVNTESSDDDFPDPNRKRKKQRLKEYEKELRRKKRLRDGRDGELMPKKRGRKPSEKSDGALLKISKKQPTVAALLQHHKAQQQLQQQKAIQDQQQQSPEQQISASPSPTQQQQVPQTLQTMMHLQSPNGATATTEAATGLVGLSGVVLKVEGSVTDAIESVIVAAREKDSNGAEFQMMSSSSDSDNGTFTVGNEVSPKLPEGISEHLEDAIKNIKAAALKSFDGKCKFFSHEVNNLLLSIELMSRELSCSQRSLIYGHLASHLPCTKETLQKRAKKLRLDQEGGKLREPMRKLKQAINEVMPSLEETYKARCLVAAEGGLKIAEESSPEDYKEERNNSDSESRDDEDKDTSSQDEEKTDRNVKIIRKKFEWNDKIRKLLCDVVQIKMKCYEVSKTRTTSADEYLKHFLDFEVKHLWPKGWMRLRKLVKESRHAHSYLTDPPKKNIVPMKKILPTISLLPLGSKSASSTTNPLEVPLGTSILKSSQQSVLTVSSVVSAVTSSTTTCTEYSPARTPTSLLRPQVSITPTSVAASTTKDPEPPSIIVTPVTTPSSKSSHLTPTTRSSPVMLSTKSSPVMFNTNTKLSPTSHTAKPSTATVPSSPLTSSSVIHNATNSVSVSFQPSKVQSANTESSSKLSNRSYKSLFDVSAVSAIATADNVQKFGAGVSSAKDFLSEIINKSLADYSNSDKLSSSGYKYRDSPKFTSVLGKCTPNVSNQKSSMDAVHEKMQGFAIPKSVVQKVPLSNSKSELRGGSVLTTSSLHKDSDHQHSSQDRHVPSSLPQDLRTQSRSVPNTTSNSSSSSSQRPASPFKVDMYMPDYLPLSSKFAASVPFHSLYDIQGAIERGLQGQTPAPITILSSSPSVSTKVKPRSIPPSASQPSYYSTATAEQPLNFSTSRQSSVSERISGHNLSRNVASPQMSMGSSQDRSRGSSPLTTSSTSVRMVSLPQHQTNKSSSNSTISGARSVSHHDPVLEGIAASMQEYHLKKTQRSGERSPPRSKLASSRSDLSSLSPPTSHVHANHNLSKVYSTYTDPIHSITQGSTDHRFHRPRCNRPPTIQGNGNSPEL